ncbi:MAG: endonuclease/exonuclease/phosphatase family protein, partial [bacterium]
YSTRGIIRNTETVDGKPEPTASSVDADKLRFLDVLADRLVAERPQVVTLNEVCGNQLTYLRQKLASSYPMTVTFFPDKEEDKKTDKTHPNCPDRPDNAAVPAVPGPTKQIGMGILTLGPAVQIPAPNGETPENPNGVPAECVLWDRQGGPQVHVCVVHLPAPDKPEEKKKNPKTIELVGQALSGCADSGPVILAGDFNAAPGDAVMDSVYSTSIKGGKGRFYEADMCGDQPECREPKRAGEGTNATGSEKIDYVFADDAHFDQRMTAKVENTEDQCGAGDIDPFDDCSDHQMLWANLTLGQPGTGVATGGLGVIPAGPDPDALLFDFDKAEIQSAAELDQVATQMIAQCFDEVIIEGHADSKGSPKYNLALSKRAGGGGERLPGERERHSRVDHHDPQLW